ncbi:MAG: L,D-transpeptidase family protein [Gammaproteobacteria bacterium]|nr:L,D-transpeptidase family protein [Gammaproteobacteria bacterium]
MIRALSITLLFCFSIAGHAQNQPEDYEQGLLQTISDIQQSNHEQALTDTRKFLQQYPTSKVAQLLLADLITANAGVLSSIGSGISAEPELNDLTFELRQRLSHQSTPALQGLLPDNIIQLSEHQDYVIVIDQTESRLYVYRNQQGTPLLETSYFVTIGLKGAGKEKSGDQKTPVGVYHVTRHIEGRKLPDLYGKGAFPVNYPNSWDLRKNRSGDGIWLHGTPSYTYNRAPWASDGCMVVSNEDFLDISRYINPDQHTTIINTHKINWITADAWREQQQMMRQALDQWISDWESNIIDNYMQNYSESDFSSNGRDYRAWETYKRRVNHNRKNIDIEYSNLNIFKYPGEQNLVLMQYDQAYRSSNLNADNPKELFWQKQGNHWKIVYEGTRKLGHSGTSRARN